MAGQSPICTLDFRAAFARRAKNAASTTNTMMPRNGKNQSFVQSATKLRGRTHSLRVNPILTFGFFVAAAFSEEQRTTGSKAPPATEAVIQICWLRQMLTLSRKPNVCSVRLQERLTVAPFFSNIQCLADRPEHLSFNVLDQARSGDFRHCRRRMHKPIDRYQCWFLPRMLGLLAWLCRS